MLRSWLDEAKVPVRILHQRLTVDHFTSGQLPTLRKLRAQLAGEGLSWDLVEAVADVCFPDDDGDAASLRLTGPKELWHRAQSAPTATDGSGPQVTAREVLETQRQALAAYEELNRARRAFEASEQARHQALLIATYLFGMLGQAQAKVLELTRRIDALNRYAVRERSDGHGLEQTLYRAEQQELQLRTQLSRAESDRDRAQKVADHAARRIDELEAELAALRTQTEAASPPGDTSGLLRPVPLLQPRSDEADLDAVDNALEKVRFALDREYDAVQEAAEDLGLCVAELTPGNQTISIRGRTSSAADDARSTQPDRMQGPTPLFATTADNSVTTAFALAGVSRQPSTAASAVTISFAGFNRAWAVWIGDRLERRGHRVAYQRWDPPADAPLVDLLRELKLAAEGTVLIIVSEWYFHLGPRTHEEWNAALREVVAPAPSRFAAVSVTTASVPPATSNLAPVDLTNTGADEAERRLLARLDLPYEPMPDAIENKRGPRFPSAAPEVWGGVPRRNTRFTGREPLLNDAYNTLRGSEPGAGVLTLHGMSGVGKTQFAAEYVYRFGSEYDVVWWVNAESRVTYRRLLAELAPQLGLSTGAAYGERLRAVREALRRGEPFSRWLLILDGADEPGQIEDLVPTGPGHVLITSRNPEWSEHNSKLLEVPVYGRGESIAFIRRHAPRLTEAEADQLAEALEDLPLLMAQTAGWLNDSDLSVEDYIGLLEHGVNQDLVKVSADFPLAFQTAWSILLNKLRETVPESVDLLRLCTFFAPGSIPVRLLTEMPHDDLPEQLSGLLDDPLLWNRAINQLRQYSMVRLESDESGGGTLYLHRMVHQIVHADMPSEDRLEFNDVVRQALVAADPRRPEDTRLWSGYAEIVPHLEHSDVLKSKDAAAQLLVLNCLHYMYLSGEYHAGIKLGERAMNVWRALLGENHPRFWELTRHYANLLRAVGDYERTEAIERAAVDHLREQRGEQDLDYLSAATGLASDLWGLARYVEALKLTERIFTTYRDLLGEQHSQTLNARNNVAVSLRLLGRYAESLEIDRETMEARRLLQKGHDALFSEVSYAIGQRLLGRYRNAELIQAKNVREYRIVMGPDNPQTLRAEHNLAWCHYSSGDRERAGKLFTRVLERGERVMGETHPWTLMFAAGQSCFAREQGDIDQAQEIDEFVVAHYEAMLPEGHPFIAGVRANHALMLQSVGEGDQAHAVMEQSLAAMIMAVGAEHPWTLGCAINATALRNLIGDPKSAAALGQSVVTQATEVLGRAHPLTLSARFALAADLRSLGDHQQAEIVDQEAKFDLATTPGNLHTLSARSGNRPYWDFEPQAT